MYSAETRVGQLASEHFATTRVFARHGIDYCCGGQRTLAQACEAAGVDTSQVLAELLVATQEDDGALDWSARDPAELIEHLLVRYHAPLREELPRLESMLRKLVDVHGAKALSLALLLQVFLELRADLEPHLLKEEQVLFPMILHGQGSMAGGPIACMGREHDHAGALLARIRELTAGFVAPPEACPTWKATWAGLAELERELHEHIHLENNVLFPRVLALTTAR